MNKLHTPFGAFTCLILLTSVVLTGCGDKASTDNSAKKKPVAKADDHDHDEHAHPTEGPHGGSLIELGKEEYHAELVHDDAAKTVTIYLLDSHAEKSVPIDAKKIVINLAHDGNAEQFELTASPDKGDPQGKSSRFASKDEELAEDLDLEDLKAKLSVKIGDKSYSGDIKHDHEGEGRKEHSHKK